MIPGQESELIKEDEVELNHIHDPQVRTELKKVVSAKKPEKTEAVDVFMKIV